MSLLRQIQRSAVGLTLAVGVSLAAYYAIVFFQVWRQANRDEAARADVIVVFGAAEYRGRPSPVLKARLDHALELYRNGLAPRILTTGGHGGDPHFTEGEVGRSYLAKHDVPSEMILVEPHGESTMESAAAVAEIMDRMRMDTCIVVSDGYHIYRVKKMLEAQGIRAFGSPREPGSDPPLARAWYYARQAAGFVLWKLGIHI